MNILVFGGSYFLGKCFVKKAICENTITVFNRGNKPLDIPLVSVICGDRHDKMALSALEGKHFDAVVDFCAYSEGDISDIFEINNLKFNRYIFVSTSDVYERGLNSTLDETAPMERRCFGGVAGDYISGKVALEDELVKCAYEYGVAYTSIRPAFIYGPDNYAPRENMYFQWINKAGQILQPQDATGEFQLVYVEDVADAILGCIGNEAAYNRSYNLAPDIMENYETFVSALKEAIDTDFEEVLVTVSQVNEKNIPLPFPLTKEESNRYDGSAALELIGQYTKLSDGLRKTYEFWKE